MPVESPPESGAIWFDNWILQATIAAYTSQLAGYAAKNLLTPHRSDTWRSANATSNQDVIFDLGESKSPSCLAIADGNFDAGAYIILRGADNSALTGGVRYDLPLYPQDDIGKVLRWYLGDPTSGTAGAYRFWAVRFWAGTFGSYNTTEDLIEMGVVWLGQHTNIIPEQGVRPRPRDPSERAQAYGGAPWVDPLRPYREIDLSVRSLTFDEFYDLEALIRKQGSSHAILDLHAFSTNAKLKRGGCLYGTFDPSPADGELEAPETNSLRIKFGEARG